MEYMNNETKADAHVYVIGIKDSQRALPYTKVGIAQNVESRIKGLSTGMPFDIFLHASAGFKRREAALWAEYKIHQALDNLHVKGEWFAGTPSVHMYKIRQIVSEVERSYLNKPLPKIRYRKPKAGTDMRLH